MARLGGTSRRPRCPALAIVAVAAWLGLAAPGAADASEPARPSLTILSGSPGGAYESVGCLLAALADRAGAGEVEIVRTAGSVDNIRRLARAADRPVLALVQEADLAEATTARTAAPFLDRLASRVYWIAEDAVAAGHAPTDATALLDTFARVDLAARALAPLRIVSVLYDEPIHVVTATAGLEELPTGFALSAVRIATGPLGSGSARDALFLLGVTGAQFDPNRHRFAANAGDALDRLVRGDVDLAIVTGAAPMPALARRVAEHPGLRLLGLPRDALELSREVAPERRMVLVAGHDYRPGSSDSIATLADRALLVATWHVPADLLRRVLVDWESLARDEGAARLAGRLAGTSCPASAVAPGSLLQGGRLQRLVAPPSEGLSEAIAVAERLGLEPHAVTQQLQTEGFARGSWRRLLDFLPFGGGLVLLLMTLYWAPRTQLGSSDLGRGLQLVALLLLIWLAGAIAMHFFESSSPFFGTLPRAFWSTATYLLSGFEDKEPSTQGGRVTSIVMILSGIGLVASATGEFASRLTAHRHAADSLAVSHRRGHVVVCLRDPALLSVVGALLDAPGPQVRGRRHVVLLPGPPARHDPDRVALHARGVVFLAGDPESARDLGRAGVERARAVVVVQDAAVPLASLRTVVAVRDSLRDASPRPRLVVYGSDAVRRSTYEQAGADEVVQGVELARGLLAQTTLTPAVAEVHGALIGLGTARAALRRAGPKSLAEPWDLAVADDAWRAHAQGRLFREVVRAGLAGQLTPHAQVVVIGLLGADGQVRLNPREPDAVLVEGDRLLVVAGPERGSRAPRV